MKNKILIYSDNAFDIYVLYKEVYLYCVNYGISVERIDTDRILYSNKLNDSTLALIMPGGASDIYEKQLGEKGNDKIREYVSNGGSYFGICAGAYYACKNTEFEIGQDDLEINKSYGLDLVEAKAVGSLSKELNINSFSRGPEAVDIVDVCSDGNIFKSYYHGGPKFEHQSDKNKDFDVIANYHLPNSDDKASAIVEKNYDNGYVCLSGVHPEVSYDCFKEFYENDYRYENILNKLKQCEESRKALFYKLMDKIKEKA